MKASELRTKTSDELNKELDALSREQFSLRMQIGSGQSVKVDRMKQVRRDIARVKTVLNEMSNNKVENDS